MAELQDYDIMYTEGGRLRRHNIGAPEAACGSGAMLPSDAHICVNGEAMVIVYPPGSLGHAIYHVMYRGRLVMTVGAALANARLCGMSDESVFFVDAGAIIEIAPGAAIDDMVRRYQGSPLLDSTLGLPVVVASPSCVCVCA